VYIKAVLWEDENAPLYAQSTTSLPDVRHWQADGSRPDRGSLALCMYSTLPKLDSAAAQFSSRVKIFVIVNVAVPKLYLTSRTTVTVMYFGVVRKCGRTELSHAVDCTSRDVFIRASCHQVPSFVSLLTWPVSYDLGREFMLTESRRRPVCHVRECPVSRLLLLRLAIVEWARPLGACANRARRHATTPMG